MVLNFWVFKIMEIHADVYLIFLALAVCFSAAFVVNLWRIRGLNRFLVQFKSAKLLYYFLLIQQFFRVLSFWYFCIFSAQLDLKNSALTFTLLSIPDSLMICSLIVLLWVLITTNIFTRIESDEENLYVWNIPSLYRLAMMTLKVLIIWICFELMLYVFLAVHKISRQFIVYQQCAWCIIASSSVIYSVIYLQFKYSGVPFKDSNEARVMKRVNFVSFIWSFARIIHIVCFWVREVALNDPDDLNEISDNTAFLIVAVCDFFICELYCYYLVLNRAFLKTFIARKANDVNIPLVARNTKENVFMEIKDQESEDLNLVVNQEIFKQKGKLGSLYQGVYNDKSVIIRRILLKRVSSYVIEELQQEVESLKNISNPFILQNIKVVIKKPTLDIIMPLAKGGSLYNLLHTKQQKISFKEKIKIAKDIALGMKLTHEQGRVHGHLSSHNIFIEPNSVLISDLGLEHLKKYVGLLEGYCNKNGWSSPEVLKDSGNVVIKPQFSDDVYSFGMILWEMMTEQEPFADYTSKKLKELVSEQGFRPTLNQIESKGVEELLKSCWNTDPGKRPSFSLIYSTLTTVFEE